MKINRSMLAAVVMVVGSLAATGCSKGASQGASPQQTDAPAQASASAEPTEAPAPAPEPVKAAAAAPVTVATSPGILAGPSGVRYARPAPPPLRFEDPGRAPSPHHVFRRGFWQWDLARAVYGWVPGVWEDQAASAPCAPPPARAEDPGLAPSPDYAFVRGFYRWDGHDYHWVPGHWEARRDADTVLRADYVKIDGRWVLRHQRRHDHDRSVTVSVGVRGRS